MGNVTVLQAPVDLSSATRVGPRVYRKQVLAKRSIDYPMPDGTTQHVDFDDDYLRDLAAAYNEGAFETVPFQLADRHSDDPRHYGGRVLGAEVTPDGLDLILELSADSAELVEKTERRLGVSARIVPQRTADGRTFKRAIRHVLGTFGPRITGLRGWEPVDLAADEAGPVIDLTGYPYTQEGNPMPRIIDLSAMTDEQRENLETWAATEGIDLSALEADDAIDAGTEDDEPYTDDEPDQDDAESDDEAEGDESDDDESDEPAEDDDDEASSITDDELEALIDAELAAADLSADDVEDDETLDLSADEPVELDTPEAKAARMRFTIASQRLASRGVPPALIDLAAPILSLPDDDEHALDLASPSTGETVDVRRLVRDMLEAAAGTVDLSAEHGYSHDEGTHDDQAEATAQRWADYIDNNN